MAASQSLVLRALDMVTRPAAPFIETLGPARAAHFKKIANVMADDNIVAVGVSEKQVANKSAGELTVCFYVKKKLAPSRVEGNKMVPAVINMPGDRAVFTDVKVLGELKPELQVKAKPLQSGFSIGHVKSTAGTLGAIVRRASKYHVLSNAHVLALSGKAKPGDKIVYQGPADGGKDPANLVARLVDFIPFDTSGALVNNVDAALAEIDPELYPALNFAIHKGASPTAIGTPKRGMKVVKSGRTSGKTRGEVTDVNFRFVIQYPGVGGVGYLDQVLCTRYTEPGDSGSIVVDEESGQIVGLHFAGAENGSVFNPIKAVRAALKFQFV